MDKKREEKALEKEKEMRKIEVVKQNPKKASKDNMIKLNEQMGNRPSSAEEKEKIRKNKDNVCARAHLLVKKYMPDDKFENECALHKERKTFVEYEVVDAINKKAKRGEVEVYEDIIDNLEFCNEMFDDSEFKGQYWKVLKVPPEFSDDGKAIYVQCWFPQQNWQIRADLMKVSQVAKAYVTWALVAYVAENLDAVKALDQSADKKLSARARAIGFDTVRRTLRLNRYRAELKESEGMSFTTGFLYSDAQTLEYAPEKLLQHNMVVPVHRLTFKQTMLNDCLTFAVNQFLRWAFFVAR